MALLDAPWLICAANDERLDELSRSNYALSSSSLHRVLGSNLISTSMKPTLHAFHAHKCLSLVENSENHHRLWAHARRIAGRHYKVPSYTTFTAEMFFTQHHDCRVFNITNVPIQYRINWKGGSANLVANLESLQERTGGYLPEYRAVHKDTNVESRLISKAFGFQTVHDMKSFSFVRDPLSHFLAGLREYFFRVYKARFIVSPDFLEQTLHDMLDRNMTFVPSTLHSVMHIFPQAGILTFNANPRTVKFPRNLPTFVGKLENFKNDWDVINKMYGLNISLERDKAVHPTQEDPNRVGQAFSIVMERNKPLMKALCVLLYVDYVCFDYAVPLECKSVFASFPK